MDKQVIEINGVKLEVDMRYARRIDTLTVGSKVKLLQKKDSYSGAKVYSGVIVGFEPFKELPTIIVAYLESDWNSAKVAFAYINKDNEKFDLVPSIDDDLAINKADTLEKMKREIVSKQREIEEIERRMAYFEAHFGAYFEPAAA